MTSIRGFRHKIDRVFDAAVRFFLAPLAAEAANFRNRHPGDPGCGQCIFDVFHAMVSHDSFDPFHDWTP
jgi:hypothetical protein